MGRTVTNILLAALAATAAVLLALKLLPSGWILPKAASPSTPAAVVDAAPRDTPAPAPGSRIVALGTLIPDGGVIDVTGTPGDRLAEILVQPGDTVKADDVLVKLESFELRESEVNLAEGSLSDGNTRRTLEDKYGQLLVKQAQMGVEKSKLEQSQLDDQRSRLKVLEEAVMLAQRQLDRMQGLDDSIIAPALRERQQLAVHQAESELAAARHALEYGEESGKLAVRAAEAKVEEADLGRQRLLAAVPIGNLEQSVSLARKRLGASVVQAPRQGRVFEVLMRPGEIISQRPILRMGDTSRMYATAEVYETDVDQVRVGQRAEISSAALSSTLTGTVDQVGTMVAKNEVVSIDPTKSADLRIVKVRVVLDEKWTTEAARLVNLQVRVAIDVGKAATP